MDFVKIAHPQVDGEGECALSALPLWEGLGWRRVGHAPQVIDLTPPETPPPSIPDPPTSPKASRRAATNEE